MKRLIQLAALLLAFSFPATAAITLVANAYASAHASGSGAATTAGVDTTGATLLVVVAVTTNNCLVSNATISDSKGNTWHSLTVRSVVDGLSSAIFYAYDHGGTALSVGSGHTFSVNPNSCNAYGGLSASAWSGTLTTDPFDVQNGASTATFNGTLATGSITPSADNMLVITGFDSRSTATPSVSNATLLTYINFVSGSGIGVALGYVIQTTAAAIDTTWTANSGYTAVAMIASFKPAASAGMRRRVVVVQ